MSMNTLLASLALGGFIVQTLSISRRFEPLYTLGVFFSALFSRLYELITLSQATFVQNGVDIVSRKHYSISILGSLIPYFVCV